MRKEIYANHYFSVFEDGTMGLSDGVGYLDTLEREEVKKLHETLKEIFEKDDNSATFGQRCVVCGKLIEKGG